MQKTLENIVKLWFDPTRCRIGGQEVSAGEGTLTLKNPSNGSDLAEIAAGSFDEIDQAVTSARSAYNNKWRRTSAADRGRFLFKLADLVRTHAEALAILESLDVGKPLTQSKADVTALIRYLEFYGGAADKIHGETIPFQEGYTVYTLREPHGVTGHIIPWNYPMQIIGRSVGAALAMGNSCVLKPAEDACLTALAFGALAEQAGIPEGCLNIVPGLGEKAGAALCAHPGINHVSFTGSVGTGIAVQSSSAQNVVPVTLELGGKSPQLVFEDADLQKALPFLVRAGIQNAGQTCSASSRILVHRSRLQEVSDKMAQAYASLKVGPALEDHDVGPLISARQHDLVSGFLNLGGQVIARAELSPELPEKGYYLAPTLLGGVKPKHRLAQEEIFGPVQVILPFDDDEEAIDIANGTEFGLVASIWSRDGARQMRLARELKAGQVFINNYGAGGGVELPFGGVGKSGHGREKGFEALYGFSVLKTVAAHHG